MQISTLTFENVMGARDVTLDLAGRRLGIFAGENASGKSSCAEGVRLCLRGVAERAPAKKDWRLLVSDGAQTGTVRIQFADGNAARLMLPTGTGSSPLAGLDEVRAQAWALALGHQQMSGLKAKERRSLITRLLGEESAHDKLAAALVERGLDQAKITTITPMLRAGLEAANKDVLDRAREAKGAWRGVTGEDWGAKKAPSWPATDPGPKPTKTSGTVLGEAGAVSRAMDDLQRQIGAADAVVSAEDLDKMRTTAGTFKVRDKKRGTLADEVKALEKAVGVVERQITAGSQPEPLTCTCCGAKQGIKDNVLVDFKPMPEGWMATIKQELADKKADLATKRAALSTAEREAGEAETAGRKLRAAEAAAAVDVEALKGQRAAKQEEHAQLLLQVEQIRAYDGWVKRRDDALRHHQDVTAWLAISEALQDPALMQSETAGPGERFNLELAYTTAGIGWKNVEVGEDGELRYGDRPVTFCSESERWRADAACAIAVAKLAGLGLVLLDRVDVIDASSRPALFRWLTVDSGLDTVLAFITVKERPKMPDSVAVIWLGAEKVPAEAAA